MLKKKYPNLICIHNRCTLLFFRRKYNFLKNTIKVKTVKIEIEQKSNKHTHIKEVGKKSILFSSRHCEVPLDFNSQKKPRRRRRSSTTLIRHPTHPTCSTPNLSPTHVPFSQIKSTHFLKFQSF